MEQEIKRQSRWGWVVLIGGIVALVAMWKFILDFARFPF